MVLQRWRLPPAELRFKERRHGQHDVFTPVRPGHLYSNGVWSKY
jgi:hypothetical protein